MMVMPEILGVFVVVEHKKNVVPPWQGIFGTRSPVPLIFTFSGVSSSTTKNRERTLRLFQTTNTLDHKGMEPSTLESNP